MEYEGDIELMPKGSISVFVTHVESPYEIFIQDSEMLKSFTQEETRIKALMIESLKRSASHVSAPLSRWVGKFVSVRVHFQLSRGIVIGVKEDSKLICRLIDSGETIEALAKHVHKLPNEARALGPFCVWVQLANVIPLGTGNVNKWSLTAIDYFKELIKGKQLFLQTESEGFQDVDGFRKISGSLQFVDRIVPGPFSPLIKNVVDLATDLADKGLALSKKTVTQEAKILLSDLANCGFLKLTLEEEESKEQEVTNVLQWPMPIRPTEISFSGVITFIDDHGQMFIQTKKAKEITEAMTKILTLLHSRLPLRFDYDLDWLPGDILIAKSSNGWSRGVITNVLPSERKVEVLLVDYGVTRILDPKRNECHKSVMFCDVPIQTLRCQFKGPASVNYQYAKEFIHDISSEFLNKSVTVKVLNQADSFPLHVQVNFTESIDRMGPTKGNLATIFHQKRVARGAKSIENCVPGIEKSLISLDCKSSPLDFTDLVEICHHYPNFLEEKTIFTDAIPVRELTWLGNSLYVLPDFEVQGLGSPIKEYMSNVKATVVQKLACYTSEEGVLLLQSEILVGFSYLTRKECGGNGHYFRCVVLHFLDEDQVSVLDIDRGDTHTVRVNALLPMPVSFLRIPMQTCRFVMDDEKRNLLQKQIFPLMVKTDTHANSLSLYVEDNKTWRKI